VGEEQRGRAGHGSNGDVLNPPLEAIPRSYLFVPGNRPERFAKALASGAHAVIVDLEDAVPAAEKTAARSAVAAALDLRQPVIVRINGVDTDWFRNDVTICRMPGVAAIMLPKTEGIEHLRRVEELLGGSLPILPLIETAHGFANALEIAKDRAVRRLVFGAIDFQLDLGIRGDTDELLFFRSQLVLVSRLAGIAAPVARIGIALEQYDFEPDAVVDEIHRRTSVFDLKLDFRDRGELMRFLRAYEALVRSPGVA